MSNEDCLKPLTFGSLFAGIGGFDLGFARAGMLCKWQVEIDNYANAILSQHWPAVPRFRDVRAFPPRPDSPWLGADWRQRFEVDVVCGGFPCQDISYAGPGAGLEGVRSGLFFEVIRIVRQLNLRIIVLENVSALLTRGLDRVLGTLAEVGYDAEWHCIPASSIGANHRRDRIFILAYSNNSRLQRMRFDGENKRREDSDRHIRPSGVVLRDISRHRKHWNVEPAVGELVNGVSGGLVQFTGRTGRAIPRRIEKLKALGNAVVPQVAEVVAGRILEMLHCENGG